MSDWDVIEVPKALAKAHMACINLVLNDRTVVVPSEEPLNFHASGQPYAGLTSLPSPVYVTKPRDDMLNDLWRKSMPSIGDFLHPMTLLRRLSSVTQLL